MRCLWAAYADENIERIPIERGSLIWYSMSTRKGKHVCPVCLYVSVCVAFVWDMFCVCVCSLYVCAYACVRFVYITHIKENNCIIQGNARMRKNRKYEKKTTKTLNYK